MDWKAFLGPIVAAVLIDFLAFFRARQKDPTVRFAWERVGERVLIGVLTGLGFATDIPAETLANVAQIAL